MAGRGDDIDATGAATATDAAEDEERGKRDLAALARGGRINFFGFILRLLARIPFLFIAGRFYGAEALGRFAFALVVVEFAAILSTLGLKRGLAQQLSKSDPSEHTHIAWDGLVVAMVGSLVAMTILFLFPNLIFPNSEIRGLEGLIPITVLLLAWTEVMLAACNYRHDIASTVRSRAVVAGRLAETPLASRMTM